MIIPAVNAAELAARVQARHRLAGMLAETAETHAEALSIRLDPRHVIKTGVCKQHIALGLGTSRLISRQPRVETDSCFGGFRFAFPVAHTATKIEASPYWKAKNRFLNLMFRRI